MDYESDLPGRKDFQVEDQLWQLRRALRYAKAVPRMQAIEEQRVLFGDMNPQCLGGFAHKCHPEF